MQATAHAAAFSFSYPGGWLALAKHKTRFVLCNAAAYRNLISDSFALFKVLTVLL